MTHDPASVPHPTPSSYSTRFRTALVMTGAGTAGAYQAGVLKALTEAGVRIDIVAGHGIGVVTALFAALDGGARLWAADGAWLRKPVRRFYRWRPAVRALAWAVAAAVGLVVVPMILLSAGTFVYLVSFLLGLVGFTTAAGVAEGYTALVRDAFLPHRLPTWIPQLALVLLGLVFVFTLVASRRARTRGRQRESGRFWWRVLGAPLSARGVIDFWISNLWHLLVGGAKVSEPDSVALSHRYSELLAENLGQPGFREVVATVHDLDSRQDVTMAALAEPYRKLFFSPSAGVAGGPARAGETFDLVGADRDHVTDVLAAALCLPVAMSPWAVTLAPGGFWQGETHRYCDRPGALGRLLDDVATAGAEQVIVVSASSTVARPHALASLRLDGFGKLGEWMASQDAAATREAVTVRQGQFRNLHVIRPAHNPTGPFDFDGAYDERSDRVQGLAEVIGRGYDDAYHQFIEPVVGGADDVMPAPTPGR